MSGLVKKDDSKYWCELLNLNSFKLQNVHIQSDSFFISWRQMKSLSHVDLSHVFGFRFQALAVLPNLKSLIWRDVILWKATASLASDLSATASLISLSINVLSFQLLIRPLIVARISSLREFSISYDDSKSTELLSKFQQEMNKT